MFFYELYLFFKEGDERKYKQYFYCKLIIKYHITYLNNIYISINYTDHVVNMEFYMEIMFEIF